MGKMEAKYVQAAGYLLRQQYDSSLVIFDQLIAYAKAHRLGEKQFQFEFDRATALTEAGRYRESDEAIDAIFRKSSADNGAADNLHMIKAVNALNSGDLVRAKSELALADSFAVKLRGGEDDYYNKLLQVAIEYSQTGRVRLGILFGSHNRLQGSYHRMRASQGESERSALQQHNRALTLKVKNEHKSVVILIIVLALLVTIACSAWIIVSRRHRERDNEERAEALQKMVDDLKANTAPASDARNTDALRRAMLQHLGIIKMPAETPTQQNRNMLYKISSVSGETNGELVNWDNVYELIGNLYSNFYTKLHNRAGEALTDKEEHIVVLMAAGFSTKEISVITGQTTATIYVRKTSVRKKLGLPEKGDIVSFLRQESSC